METIQSWTPLWACLASLLAVIPIVLFGRKPDVREGFTFLAGLIKFGLVLSMLPIVLDGKIIECVLVDIVPNVPLAFRVDGLGILFALVASFLWIPTSCYAIGYMRGLNEHSQTRFFAFFAVSLFATLGVAFAGNLLTLYVFYEMLSLATFPLVTHHQDKEARTGGRTYLSHLLTTSIGFALPAIIFCFIKADGGPMNFTGFLGDTDITRNQGIVVLLLLTFGFAKNGLMPFHSWLPGAMVAPTPVSALLHAVAVVKVGVFCVIRVFTGVFGLEFLRELDIGIIVSWIAAFTVITSSLIALSQDSLKRRLAFSTIGQLAYIVLGVSLLTPHGVNGSMMHIAMHAFGKITLFFCAGAIFVATGKKYVSQLDGLGRRMPVLMAAFTVGAISVIGLPLTGGMWSKFYLVWGAGEADQIGLMVVFIISSLLNAAYFFPIVTRAFLRPLPEDEEGETSGAPITCVAPIVVTALGTIALFFFPGLLLQLANLISQNS
ncbi:monovalent cation/H+ antiporter subunit D family protein [Haloferula sp.]|uniref:monovalent cation/H+ antiporter subunit D family protein n=1 Tax=Haloferula sp. TaxID=2497595 RepID=UPI00329A8A02